MTENIEESLKQKAFEFVMREPGYDPSEYNQIRVICADDGYALLFGSDEMAGIMGIGKTPDEVWDDFKRSWNQLGGFEWIRKNNA